MKRILLLLIIALGVTCTKANKQPQISILTCEKGDRSYTAFGHTAIRIYDQSKKINQVYNFGLFDFNTPNFNYKFLKAELNYKLGIQPYWQFLRMYQIENRTVWEQQLNLSDALKQKIIDTLKVLYKPANRYYQYHFLTDNCTSKVRDVIFGFLSHKQAYKNHLTSKSYSRLINNYLTHKPLMKAGINLVTGIETDILVTQYQKMAFPVYLMEALDTLTVNKKPLVHKKQQVVYSNQAHNKRSINWFFWGASLMMLVYLIFRWKYLIYAVSGFAAVAGVLILTLWLFSGHTALHQNYDILWANPLYLLMIVPFMKKYKRKLCGIFIVLIFVRIILHISGIQAITLSFAPILIILLLHFSSIMFTGRADQALLKKSGVHFMQRNK